MEFKTKLIVYIFIIIVSKNNIAAFLKYFVKYLLNLGLPKFWVNNPKWISWIFSNPTLHPSILFLNSRFIIQYCCNINFFSLEMYACLTRVTKNQINVSSTDLPTYCKDFNFTKLLNVYCMDLVSLPISDLLLRCNNKSISVSSLYENIFVLWFTSWNSV